MFTHQTTVVVPGLTAQAVYDFMLHCTDEQYQRWWPGTHLAFHTIKQLPNDLGNLVYFDEKVGSQRIKFKAVVTQAVPSTRITWQMKKVVLMPGWLTLTLSDSSEGVQIVHILKAGFNGVGRIFDPILRFVFAKYFEQDLVEHANKEFNLLKKLLS